MATRAVRHNFASFTIHRLARSSVVFSGAAR